MAEKVKTIVFDLDGTITSRNTFPYLSKPNKKVVEYIKKLMNAGYEVYIYSARWNVEQNGKKQAKEQIENVKKYLKDNDIPYTKLYESDKPRAVYYVDDKAVNVKDIKELDKLIESNFQNKDILVFSSVPNPLRKNEDYGMNWIDRVKNRRLKRKEKINAFRIGIKMIRLSQRDNYEPWNPTGDTGVFALALNPNTDSDILDKLSTHESNIVKMNVAENPNTSKKTLLKLLKHNDDLVREYSKKALEKRFGIIFSPPLINFNDIAEENDEVDTLRSAKLLIKKFIIRINKAYFLYKSPELLECIEDLENASSMNDTNIIVEQINNVLDIVEDILFNTGN